MEVIGSGASSRKIPHFPRDLQRFGDLQDLGTSLALDNFIG
jgi:hypothetical protein